MINSLIVHSLQQFSLRGSTICVAISLLLFCIKSPFAATTRPIIGLFNTMRLRMNISAKYEAKYGFKKVLYSRLNQTYSLFVCKTIHIYC